MVRGRFGKLINRKTMNRYYVADEGYTYIRKADGFDMGSELWLGENDSIDNYEIKGVEQINE